MDLNALDQLSALVVAVLNAHADPPLMHAPIKFPPILQTFIQVLTNTGFKLSLFTLSSAITAWYF